MLRATATALSDSFLLGSARRLWTKNQRDWMMPLSTWQKLLTGSYLILRDYGAGEFPPTFDDQQAAYDAEMNYGHSLPGLSRDELVESSMRRPFWNARMVRTHLANFTHMCVALEDAKVLPPQKLLELGCGHGWAAELFATMEYQVVGTTIAPEDVADAEGRIEALRCKGLEPRLEFRSTPMESVAEAVGDVAPFDAVFVYEALHHAYDWRATVASAFSVLKPGGWLFIFTEPNLLHTFASYRVATLSNTHEIGFRRSELSRELRRTGFRKTVVLRNRVGFFTRPIWLSAQK